MQPTPSCNSRMWVGPEKKLVQQQKLEKKGTYPDFTRPSMNIPKCFLENGWSSLLYVHTYMLHCSESYCVHVHASIQQLSQLISFLSFTQPKFSRKWLGIFLKKNRFLFEHCFGCVRICKVSKRCLLANLLVSIGNNIIVGG